MRPASLLLSSVLLFSACGTKTSGSGAGGSGVVAAGDFVARWVEATCGEMGTCCMNANLPFDRDACVTSMTREGQSVLADTNAMRTYDPAGAARCIDGVRAIFARCAYASTFKDEVQEVCKGIYAGTVAIGGACQSPKDCATSEKGPVRCTVDLTQPPLPPMPICVVNLPGLAGEPCFGPAPNDPSVAFPHHDCAEGLYCDMTSHCQARLAEGAPCGMFEQCVETDSCRNATCTPLVDLGAPCIDDFQCLSKTCYQQACAIGVPITPMACSSTP
jgi:hypothetical protein